MPARNAPLSRGRPERQSLSNQPAPARKCSLGAGLTQDRECAQHASLLQYNESKIVTDRTGFMGRVLLPSEMTAAQLLERAGIYEIMAIDAEEAHLRISFNQLAARYKAMAAEREAEEARQARH